MYRTLVPASIWSRVERLFQISGPQETAVFLLFRVGKGKNGSRLLVHDVLELSGDTWEIQADDQLRPSGRAVSAAVGAAIDTASGLAFIHSHPSYDQPPSLSPIDELTSREWGRTLPAALDAPFLSLVWSPAGVSGWAFSTDSMAPRNVDRFDIHGEGRIHPLVTRLGDRERALDARQTTALGAAGNAQFRALRVALVGVGGTGSPAAEILVRMGVDSLLLIDPDRIDDVSNLRRMVGSRPEHLRMRSEKVLVVSRHLESMHLGTKIDSIAEDVRTRSASRALLDTDLVISSTDTHGSRAFLNQLAFQFHLPVVDIGLRVGLTRSGNVSGMPADVRVLLPDNGCLWCRGVLSAEAIRAENLPADERRELEREGYVQRSPGQPSLAALNYFAAGLAVLTAARLYSRTALPSDALVMDGWDQYAQSLSVQVNPDCICSRWRGQADRFPLSYLDGIPD
jgi:hypothetical protein